MNSVPFEVDGGWSRTTGVMHLNDECLTVQYEVKDAILGVLKSSLKHVEIPWGSIAEVEFKRGFFGGTLRVIVHDMLVIEEIAWRDGGAFSVHVARTDRQQAAEFAEEMFWRIEQ